MGFKDWWTRKRGAKLTSPDGLPVVELPPAYVADLRLYGLRSSYGWLYRSQPNVRTVIDFLAREHAGVKLKVYERVSSSPNLPSGRLELDAHPLSRLLSHPAPGLTRYRLWYATVADKHIYDIAYWKKIRLRGAVKAVVRIPPEALIPQRDPFTRSIYEYRTSAGVKVPLEDLVVFHGYDPELHDGQVSSLETLRRVLAEEWAAGRNREFSWRNAARKSGVVERPLGAPPWSFEAREAWRADFESVATGESNAGRVALLEDGMQWKEAVWSPKEMEYLGARELTRRECAAAFGVDPRLVFASDSPADKETRTGFYVDRLWPSLMMLQEEIDVQLLPEFEPFDVQQRVYSEFNLEAKLRGSFEEQAKIASSAVGGPYVTVNEMRARVNLPPKDGGDMLFTPLNSVRGGGPQGSPQAPTDTPADLPGGTTPGGGTESGERAASYAELLRKHFSRQARSLSGGAAADWRRWEKELEEDFVSLGVEEAGLLAARVNARSIAIAMSPEVAGDSQALAEAIGLLGDSAEALAGELVGGNHEAH